MLWLLLHELARPLILDDILQERRLEMDIVIKSCWKAAHLSYIQVGVED